MAFLSAAIPAGMAFTNKVESAQFARRTTPKPPLSEIERWNAEVDARKAQKKLDKQHAFNMQEG